MGSGGIPATYAVSDSTPETTFEELDGERGFVAQNTGDQIVCRILSLSIWSIGVYILFGDFIRREEFPARFQLVGLLRMKPLKFRCERFAYARQHNIRLSIGKYFLYCKNESISTQ